MEWDSKMSKGQKEAALLRRLERQGPDFSPTHIVSVVGENTFLADIEHCGNTDNLIVSAVGKAPNDLEVYDMFFIQEDKK